MGEVNDRTILAMEEMRLTHLEAQVLAILSERTGMDAESALKCWYDSDLCAAVERNEYGLQYLDANYLVEELLRRASEAQAEARGYE